METNKTIRLKIHTHRRRLGSESGGTLVETAISLSLLFLLIFGLLEGSLAVYSYHYLSHAARQGARYAMVRGGSWGSTCGDYTQAGCTATSDQISQYIENLGFPGIDGSKINITVQCAAVSGTGFGTLGAYGSSCWAAGSEVQVTISYPFSIPIAGINGTCNSPTKFCMVSTSEMVIAN